MRYSIKYLFLTGILLFQLNAFGQTNGVFPIRTINPTDVNFADLQFLKKEIGDKSIVMIGEQSHLAGASIDAKARIANFLVQEMGFEVILFESGLYDVNKAVTHSKTEPKSKLQVWIVLSLG
jgi:erythromycin esterase